MNIDIEHLGGVIEPDVRDFIIELNDKIKDYDVYLAGGYLRDKYTHRTPKDIDLMLVPVVENPTIPFVLPNKTFIQYDKCSPEFKQNSDMGKRGVERLIGLSNSTLSTKEMQLIVYDRHLSILEVAKDMDMNIVQVAWNPSTDSIAYTEDFINGHKDKYIECMHEYDYDRKINRVTRMMSKYPDYSVRGFELPEVEVAEEFPDSDLDVTFDISLSGGKPTPLKFDFSGGIKKHTGDY